MNSELHKYTTEDFKLSLLQFLNKYIHKRNIPNECRKAVVKPIFKKGDRRDSKSYREISIFNTFSKANCKILNIKL